MTQGLVCVVAVSVSQSNIFTSPLVRFYYCAICSAYISMFLFVEVQDERPRP